MSYTQLRQYRDRMQKQAFRYIILDEAQMIKNPYSQTAQVCFSLQGTYRVAYVYG